MKEETELIPNYLSNSYIKSLENFLDCAIFKTPVKCPYTNIIDQSKGRTFKIPINPAVRENEMALDWDRGYIKDFMEHLEKIRCSRILMHFSETQTFELESGEKIVKSGIDLDFDIYQTTPDRKMNESEFFSLLSDIVKVMVPTFDLNTLPTDMLEDVNTENKKSLVFHACVLRKPAIVETYHNKYGKTFKESFRIRFPGIKISKEHKKYIIHLIIESNFYHSMLSDLNVVPESLENSLDMGSISHPLMFLGSAKKGGNVAHEFFGLYVIKYKLLFKTPIINKLKDFDLIENLSNVIVKVPDPTDKRRTIKHLSPLKYNYNLVYELSINYECPKGLIKKREFNINPELDTIVKNYSERTAVPIIKNEFEEVKNNVTDLVVRNYEAAYLQKILDILSPKRVSNYDDWRWIIYILAWENPDYKPLAIWFSYRFPASWNQGGLSQLEQNWNWALSHKSEDTDRRTVATLYEWARQDNESKYQEIQDKNTHQKIIQMITESCGKLNETHIAEILHTMFSKKFIVDDNPFSISKTDRRWYEFIFPNDNLGLCKGSIYKWRREKGSPDSLITFIAKKLKYTFDKVLEWMKSKSENKDETEEAQKYFEIMIRNTKDIINKLGEVAFINKIITRCEVEFRIRGFEEKLDTNPDIIGVGNGVLKVYPKYDLIQRYHEIPITRSTNVDFELYDSENEYIKHLETEIKRLFANEEDAFIKTMCYLASSLDGRKKRPLFFIWLGEGQNGKSFLLELHINTLREVVKGGYGAKLNVSFFTHDRTSGGPDSEKMMLKYARFAYCSESEPGEFLHMSKIKEFTSETISGNEKHQIQDMFEANCHYAFCSNNDPRITGRDHGTWRRILVYIFKMKFVSNPDPNNPYEYKEDIKFSELFTKDENYKKAYLSILYHYYEIYRDKYKSDLNNIYSKAIEKDTKNYQNSQDTVSRFINEQIIHIGPYYNQFDENNQKIKVKEIPLTDLIEKYIIWYRYTVDNFIPIKRELERGFKSSSLKKYISNRVKSEVLLEHYVLALNETYETKLRELNLQVNEYGKVVPILQTL